MIFEGVTALTLLCCSYHVDHHGNQKSENEFNPGVIVESGPYAAGIYYNSLRKTTVLAGYVLPIYEATPIRLDLLVAAATGYHTPVIGMLRVSYDNVLINFAPPVGNSHAIFALGWRKTW